MFGTRLPAGYVTAPPISPRNGVRFPPLAIALPYPTVMDLPTPRRHSHRSALGYRGKPVDTFQPPWPSI